MSQSHHRPLARRCIRAVALAYVGLLIGFAAYCLVCGAPPWLQSKHSWPNVEAMYPHE